METSKNWRVFKGEKEVWNDKGGYKAAAKYIYSVDGQFNNDYIIVEPNQTLEQAKALN